MGYEILKVFEFNRMSERPIGIHKGAILLKNGTENVLQLKMQNNSKQIIKNVNILIKGYDKEGTLTENQEFTYQDLFVPSGETFGDDIAISLNSDNIESVQIEFSESLDYFQNNPQEIKKNSNIKYTMIACAVLLLIIIIVFLVIPTTLSMLSY